MSGRRQEISAKFAIVHSVKAAALFGPSHPSFLPLPIFCVVAAFKDLIRAIKKIPISLLPPLPFNNK